MGLFDKLVRKGLDGIGDAVQTAVQDKVLGAIAPKAKENIEKHTNTLNDVAANLQQAAENFENAVCPSCGAPLASGARFCASCGTPVKARQSAAAAAPRVDSAAQNDIRAEMDGILASDFSAYQIQRGIDAAALGSPVAPCKPYDYCLWEGGRLAAVIMITEHNRDRNTLFLNAKKAAAQSGIPFINFYTHMPNERGYVTQRIRNFL